MATLILSMTNTDPARILLGYVQTSEGQIHCRQSARSQRPSTEQQLPWVLLHWTPISSWQYEPVMRALAERDAESYALDLPGYGQSHARPADWMIEDFAASIIEAVRNLGLSRIGLVGGHLSALIACEIARDCARRADIEVAALVLDAPPLWDAATREKMSAGVRMSVPAADDPEVLRGWLWDRAIDVQRNWDPDFLLDTNGIARVHQIIHDLVAMRFVSSATAMANYDLATRLPDLRCPTLVLGAERDYHLRWIDEVAALVPSAATHRFAGLHPLHDPGRAAEYAAVLQGFSEKRAQDSEPRYP